MLADLFGLDAIWAIVIIAVLIFGGAAIPKLARSLGSAKTQFEKGLDEGKKAGDPVSPTAAAANAGAAAGAAAGASAAAAVVETPAPTAEEKTPGA
jgi:sec-independent protein translocase protein TatA